MPKITEFEIVSNSSDISSMRWISVKLVKLGIALAVVTVLAVLASPWVPIPKESKAWDIGALISLTGLVLGAGVGGHIGQSFSPDDRPVPQQNNPPSAAPQNKVSEE